MRLHTAFSKHRLTCHQQAQNHTSLKKGKIQHVHTNSRKHQECDQTGRSCLHTAIYISRYGQRERGPARIDRPARPLISSFIAKWIRVIPLFHIPNVDDDSPGLREERRVARLCYLSTNSSLRYNVCVVRG